VRLCERTVPVVFFTGSAPNPASGGSVFFSVLIPHRNIVRLCERTVPVVFFTGSAPNPASGGSVVSNWLSLEAMRFSGGGNVGRGGGHFGGQGPYANV